MSDRSEDEGRIKDIKEVDVWLTITVVLVTGVLVWLIGEQYAAQIAAENMSNVTEVRS